MLWFQGAIPAAIASAKRSGAVFVVFVAGEGGSGSGSGSGDGRDTPRAYLRSPAAGAQAALAWPQAPFASRTGDPIAVSPGVQADASARRLELRASSASLQPSAGPRFTPPTPPPVCGTAG